MPWQNKRVFSDRNEGVFEEEFKTRNKHVNQIMLGFTSFSSNLQFGKCCVASFVLFKETAKRFACRNSIIGMSR
jgi:hypothetical protein